MNERPRPYVGISGVVNEKKVLPSGLVVTEPQQLWLEAYAQDVGMFDKTNRQLLLGVKGMHTNQFLDKTHTRDGEVQGPEWFPIGEESFADALGDSDKHPNTLGTAQVWLHPRHAGNAVYRDRFMNRIAWRGRKWLEAVQFDALDWHLDDNLLKYAQETRQQRGFKVILQCTGEQMYSLKPQGVVRKLGEFAASMDYVLFDASLGLGKDLEADRLSPFLEAAYESNELSHVNFAIAGGLSGENVNRQLSKLVQRFPEISWDAEGNLHRLNNAGKRPVQMDEAKDLIKNSTDLIIASSAK